MCLSSVAGLSGNIYCYRFVHEFSTGFPIDKMRLSVRYRTLQVLGILMNEIQKRAIVSTLIVLGIPLLSFCCTLLLTSSGSSLHIFGFFAVAGLLMIAVFLIVLGGMSQLHQESKKCIMKCSSCPCRKTSRNEYKWQRNFLASCTLIKANFGEINFVDYLTPLRCIDFSMNLTVSLVLLNN